MEVAGFLAKKIISTFFHPLGFCLLVMFVGMILWRLRPQKRLGFRLILLSGLILLVCSLPITSHLLMRSLEVQAGNYADPAELHRKGVRHIVVLAAAMVTQGKTPADRYQTSILRVLEGIRLWKAVPGSILVLSGGAFAWETSDADAMAEFPLQIGIPREALIFETRARDTDDEARLFSEIVGTKPFALVTSALHMSRAMALFRGRGLNPSACPCDFYARDLPPVYSWFLPNAGSLAITQGAIHEFLGRAWHRIRGQIRGQEPAL